MYLRDIPVLCSVAEDAGQVLKKVAYLVEGKGCLWVLHWLVRFFLRKTPRHWTSSQSLNSFKLHYQGFIQ